MKYVTLGNTGLLVSKLCFAMHRGGEVHISRAEHLKHPVKVVINEQHGWDALFGPVLDLFF